MNQVGVAACSLKARKNVRLFRNFVIMMTADNKEISTEQQQQQAAQSQLGPLKEALQAKFKS